MGGGTLLFPAFLKGQEAMLDNIPRKSLNAIAKRAGWKSGEITSKWFRRTYASARLQTVEHGAWVSPFTVAKELGHGSLAMVMKIYGQLGQFRHRSKVVKDRVEQHRKAVRGGLRLPAQRQAAAR
jgi:integrase